MWATKGSKLLVANVTGRCWGISRIRPPGQSVLANDSRSEDCAKRVRVLVGLPVLDSDWRLGRSPNSSH